MVPDLAKHTAADVSSNEDDIVTPPADTDTAEQPTGDEVADGEAGGEGMTEEDKILQEMLEGDDAEGAGGAPEKTGKSTTSEEDKLLEEMLQ